MRKKLIAILLAGYSLVIAAMTLGPQPTNNDTASLAQYVIGLVDQYLIPTFDYNNLEFIGNIALFIPLGLLLILLVGRRRWWIVVLIGVAATCGIEFTQHFLPGRVPDVRDLIANSAGAIAGLLIGLPFAGSRRSGPTPTTGSQPAIG